MRWSIRRGTYGGRETGGTPGRLQGRFKEKAREDALNSLAHEAANGVNAIRANLAGLVEDRNSSPAAEHLEQVEDALTRIDKALEKAL